MAAIESEHRDTASWVFKHCHNARERCLVELVLNEDEENFQWVKQNNMHEVIISLIYKKDDVGPIQFIIDRFKPKHPFNPHCMNNFVSYAILKGHIKIAFYFLENYSEYFKIEEFVSSCLRYYQIECLSLLWTKYPDTKEITQKRIESVMDFNTFGSDKWIAMIKFLRQNGFDVSTLKTSFTASHHYNKDKMSEVKHLLGNTENAV